MKTAVEFLYEFVLLKLTNEQQAQFEGLFNQAKQMEKEQIIESFKQGIAYWNGEEWKLIDIEAYYNETFKSE